MYIKRNLEATISKYLDSPEIIAIVGPRQCGKTTLLKKIYEKLESAVFLTFEDKSILNMFERNPRDFVDIYVKNKKYLFIDEFQYAKKGGEKLKYIFDTNQIKIIISGSSSVDLTVNAVKYLVGRIFVFNLYPFDFEEFLSFKDVNYRDLWLKLHEQFLSHNKAQIGNEAHHAFLRFYEEYVIFGGYPRVVLSDNQDEKKEILKNIYNTYFLREVRDILGLIDDYKLDKLIKALALQIGNLIEYQELGRLAEYPYATLKKYLNFLEKTFVCKLIKPYFKNKRTEIVKNPKVYFFDNGLRNMAINDFRKLNERGDAGSLLENALFKQCAKHNYVINYWRDKQKHEIDFILKMGERKEIAVEVKSFLDADKKDAFINFIKYYPDTPIFFAYRDIKTELHSPELSYPIYVI